VARLGTNKINPCARPPRSSREARASATLLYGARMKGSLALSVSLLLLFIPLPTHAQQSAPKGFYSHDYAVAPGAGAAGSDAVPEGESARPAKVAQGDDDPAPPAPNRAAKPQQPGQIVPPVGGARGKPIVIVYVNSLDAKHLNSVLEVVIELVDRKRIPLPVVYHIGDYRNVTPQWQQALAQRGVSVVPLSSIDQEVTISTSPAWFVTTKEGIHIVEGFINLGQMINGFGEFETKLQPKPKEESKEQLGAF